MISSGTDRGQLVGVVGIVVTALLAVYIFADLGRFLICVSCGMLVLGGYVLKCPSGSFVRTAKVGRIGIICATIIVPTLVLTSGRIIQELPQFLEETVQNMPDRASYADPNEATLVAPTEGPSRIVWWVSARNKVAVLETKTLGEYLSERIDSNLQIIFWVFVVAILLVLVGLLFGIGIAAGIEANLSDTRRRDNVHASRERNSR